MCVCSPPCARQYICVDPRREGVPKDAHHNALFDDIDYMDARGNKGDSSGPYGHGDHRMYTVEMEGSMGHYTDNQDNCGMACDDRGPQALTAYKDGPGIPSHMEMGCAVCSIPAL